MMPFRATISKNIEKIQILDIETIAPGFGNRLNDFDFFERKNLIPRKEVALISVAATLFLVQLLFEKQLHRMGPFGVGEYLISITAYLLAGMWEAVFTDRGTSLIAVLNSTRAFRAMKRNQTT